MVKSLPDKWIRKAIYDVVDSIEVDGETINCYDSKLTDEQPNNYILLTTQTNSVDENNKCEDFWSSSILIDIVTRYTLTGNADNRLLADNILDKVRELTNNLELDTSSGLTIIKQKQDFPNDLVTETTNEIVFRKFIRIEFLIN